jgi:hypothetical protein
VTSYKEYFEVSAELHFFLMSHAQSACDTLGGTIKRLVARVSLQQPYTHQILIPGQLFILAQTNAQNMSFEFINHKEEKLLFKISSTAKQTHGTLKLHAFLTISKGPLIVKKLSASAESEEC